MHSQSRYYGYLPSRGTSWVPRLWSPLLPSPVITSARCFHKSWCASIALGPYSSSYLCAPRPSISLILHPMALPPSPTSPSPMLSIAKLIMHLHVRIAFFHSSFVNLANIASRFLIAFFPDDALNPPSSSPPPHPRRHVLVAGIAVSTTDHHSSSSSKHHPRSIIICPRQTT